MWITRQMLPEFRAVMGEFTVTNLVSQDVIDHIGRPVADSFAEANVAVRRAARRKTSQAAIHVLDPADRVPRQFAAEVDAVQLVGPLHQVYIGLVVGTLTLPRD